MLRLRDHAGRQADPLLCLQLGRLPRAGKKAAIEPDLKATCAAAYEHPAVRWLLGGDLHPGGEASTRRALDLIGLGPADMLLDVASGTGASALLAAREFGSEVVGVDHGEVAVHGARAAADADASLNGRVSFVRGDAAALPFGDRAFDAVLCECSLCTFPDKQRAVAEMHRVLRPGGRLTVSDVVADHERLPESLRGAMAATACIATALSREGYEGLLAGAGFEVFAAESRNDDAAALARRVEDRLRGARLLGWGDGEGLPRGVEDAIALVRLAREALAEGALGYAVFAASRR